ncbi:AraC-like DNA-binding protein [Pullulanibacillus pueri]|uniref:HTH araC/xylS-type domain-containing protein n=1 Tax=Pullulanibacillus pueri TaxID=1437324 RepID=A0A8J3EKQ7_9BACL|nr:helix-turn-helix domain-containing protein [Pullulanibacillus pueri]MBM7681807.1 AraC-like DNA-binding protein [Pullulanibacillus pueri]GGH76164.1 hypothetical protein GCM10007096_06180 [Pullulanibacillus pueri]
MQSTEILFKDDDVLSLVRNRLLIDLVTSDTNKKHSLQDNLSYLKLNSSFTFPTLAVLEPSGAFRDEHEKRTFAKQILDYLKQHAVDDSIVFLDEEGHIGILFSWIVKDFVEAIPPRLYHHFGRIVNVGVGKPCNRLTDVHHSYYQAVTALQDKFYKGIGKTIYYSDSKYRKLASYPVNSERELFMLIKFAKTSAEITEAVDHFYRFLLRNGLIDKLYIYELTIRLLVGMEKRVFTEVENVSGYNNFEVMSILNMETLQDIKAYVSEHFIRLWGVIKRINNQSSIIKRIIQYMEQECQQVTLYNVAQKVYMTPTYLSSLFKMNTGRTFIEQLTDIRMERAKDLLKRTNLRNYEVAERVGYKDSRYFSQIFKRKVGITPSEYRKSVEN